MSATNRILAVDDSPTNLSILRESLAENYAFQTSPDGMSALTMARILRPEVILLDIVMPGLDGYEVCRRIKRDWELRHCRVIMVSAKTSLEDRLLGYDAGADDYVTKPFDEKEVITKIEFAIRSRQMEQMCGPLGDVLALVSELRDSGIAPNMQSTRRLAQLIAAELRDGVYDDHVDDRFLDDLHFASVLCDIGMIAVPVRLRQPQQVLDAEEIEQIKQHTLIGARLMNRFATTHPTLSLFRMAAEAARSHHERFDGRGYPDRLKGGAIPLSARIISVVNAFAGSDSSADLNRAKRSIVARNGSEFDPLVVNAMLRVFDEFVGVSQMNGTSNN